MTSTTLAISRALIDAGINQKQADAVAEAIADRIDNRVDDRITTRIDARDKALATKGDVTTAVARVEGKVNTNHANLATKDDVAELRTEVREANARNDAKMTYLLWGVGIVGSILGSMLGGVLLLLLRLLAAT